MNYAKVIFINARGNFSFGTKAFRTTTAVIATATVSLLELLRQNQDDGHVAHADSRLISNKSRRQTRTENNLLTEHFGITKEVEKGKQNEMAAVDNTAKKKTVDFIIVGYGNCGRAAVDTIQKQCPQASIAIIDPHLFLPSIPESKMDGKRNPGINWLSKAVIDLDCTNRVVETSDGERLSYIHSILIATGSRGAPPPASLIDARAMSRVLELRSTTVPPRDLRSCPASDDTSFTTAASIPSLPAITVRNISILAASQNATVGILGSGRDALELAAAATLAAHSNQKFSSNNGTLRKIRTQRSRHKQATENNAESSAADPSTPKVFLLLGNAGPLSSRLPRYLSTSVTRRLRQCGIDVHERSLVRYISINIEATSSSERLEVHSAKVSDLLDTKRLNADLLVVAPSIEGYQGTGILPCCDLSGSEALAWSNVAKDNILTCYSDDGRIAVNSQLISASGVFAAGSVARYPSHRTGTALVAGEGHYNASIAGNVVASNMAREYQRTFEKPGVFKKSSEGVEREKIFSSSSLPVWRTDECSYTNSPAFTASSFAGKHERGPLEVLGIQALCVGECDSDEMSTHGFWWTNSSTHKRNLQQPSSCDESNCEESETDCFSDEGYYDDNYGCNDVLLMTRRTARQTVHPPSAISSVTKPVFGIGVVFYINRSGHLCGIMTWGVPFTESPLQPSLNAKLFQRLKLLLSCNDGALTTKELADESKRILSLACYDWKLNENIFSVDGTMARPLYRHIAAKPVIVTNMGMLKRKGNAIDEKEMFIRRSENHSSSEQRSSSLSEALPNSGGWSAGKSPMSEGLVILDVNQNRCRPPKEDALWLRQDESQRGTSLPATLHSTFAYNMRRGKFFDGTDAFSPPPVPASVQGIIGTIQQGWTPSNYQRGDANVAYEKNSGGEIYSDTSSE